MAATTTELATTEPGMVGRAETTCWIPPAEMTHEQWTQIGNTFQQIDESINWWLGDWLLEGDKRYGEKYTQAVKYTNHKLEKLKQCRWVAKAIPPHRRRASLTWTHHRYVARLAKTEKEQDRWLRDAQNNGMSTADLWLALNGPKTVTMGSLRNTATPEQAYTWLIDTFDDEWWAKFTALIAG